MFKNFKEPRRVVITGFGCVTPIGIGRKIFWESLQNGVSGVRRIESFDVTGSAVQIAAEVRDFDWQAELNPKDRKNVSRCVPLALASAREALQDAKIKPESLSLEEKRRFGFYRKAICLLADRRSQQSQHLYDSKFDTRRTFF
jgi:3-oxoacyl-[acyl-carrier-protein] synthase II